MFQHRDSSKDIEYILHDMHDSHEFDEDELMQELETLVADDKPPGNSSEHENLILNMPVAPLTAIMLNNGEDKRPSQNENAPTKEVAL